MAKLKQMKRIGWVIETRRNNDRTWKPDLETFHRLRTDSLKEYHWVFDSYRRRGILRCVPVFVEDG